MFAVCIESSHKRGMGHFYRSLNILEYLKSVCENAVLLINNDEISIQLLKLKNILFEIVDYKDTHSNWEKDVINKYHIDVWILDKFQTGMELASHVKNKGILLVAIDDCGLGAELADLHFCSMLFDNIRGKNVYFGKEYLILNREIEKYRHKRNRLKKILITLGGSDTYGVTVKVVKIFKELGYSADVIIGPNFKHKKELQKEADKRFLVYENVPSLIAKFSDYDLAVTGGGVTCFEANASGLPCIIIANEPHEIEIGKYLAGFNGARFAGFYANVSQQDLDISNIDIESMSEAALNAVPLTGCENIYKIVQNFRRENAR